MCEETFTTVLCLFCGNTIEETDRDHPVSRPIQHKPGCNWNHGPSCTCHRCLWTRKRMLADYAFKRIRGGIAHEWDCPCEDCQSLRAAWTAIQPPQNAAIEERDADDNP